MRKAAEASAVDGTAMEVVNGSGVDGALAALEISVTGKVSGRGGGATVVSPRGGGSREGGVAAGGVVDAHPEKRRKALYREFEDRMLIALKEDHPGLKLSQYKERIFKAWEKSPENPANFV